MKPLDSPQAEAAQIQKQTKHSKRKLAVVVFILLLALAIIGIGGTYLYRVQQTQNTIKAGIHDLSQSANRITPFTAGTVAEGDRADFTRELNNLENTINDTQFKIDQHSSLLNSKKAMDEYKSFLSQMEGYVKLASGMSKDVSVITEADLKKLNQSGDAAKRSQEKLRENFTFIPESLSNEVFNISLILQKSKKSIDDTKLAEDAKAKSEEKLQIDQRTAETNAAAFLDAFIAGNADRMKRYMTAAFIKEYDFANIKPEYREVSTPVSYRVVQSQRVNSTIEVTSTVTYAYGQGQSTANYKYILVEDPKAATWMINAQAQ